jgi:hypothetical protein
MAGPIARVNEINALIRQVATTQKLPISGKEYSLYLGQALKQI